MEEETPPLPLLPAGPSVAAAAGRKRLPNRERPAAAEDDALSQIARQAEARLAAKRAARVEAREIRMKELERQQKEVEERPDKDFERGVRTVSSLSAATLASLGGSSSRRGSGDTSISIDTEASIREIKDSLAEVEEKYKKAMLSNAQLDNEKTNFMYQVDALKDALLELEEQLAESRRQYEEKNKDFEREKHAHSLLQFQFMEVKEVLKQREELLAEIQQLQQKQEGCIREMSDLQETIEWKEKKIGKHGIIPNTEVATNGETCGRLSLSIDAVKLAEDGTLGRASEMEMKNESVENVRKRELLQNTELEDRTEEKEKEEMEIVQERLHSHTVRTDGKAEAEGISEGPDASVLPFSHGVEEPAKHHSVHVPKIVCVFKNGDVAELRDEWGLLGNKTAVKEMNTENINDGNVVNKIDKQINIPDPCIEANLGTILVSEILSEEQNKENQKDILVDEAGTSDNEELEEAFDSVTQNPTTTSSQSELLKWAEDPFTEGVRIEPDVEYPGDTRKTGENKVVGSDLESQVPEGEGGFEITDEVEWGKKGSDTTVESNETENAFQRQETKVITSAVESRETLCACESAPAEFIEEENRLKMQESQSMSSQHDLLVEEEQKEQETRENGNDTGKSHTEKTKQREAPLGAMAAYSEKNNEQHAMKEILSGKTVVDSASPSGCQIHEKRILENDSRKCRATKPESIPDGETLAHISVAQKEFPEGHDEDNPTQVKFEPRGEQSTEEQVGIVQEPGVTALPEDTGKAGEGDKEDENPRKAGEMLDFVPEIQESQEVDFSIQEEKSESEDEEAGEEYHEAIDFGEFPSGELNISEGNVSQSNEEEENKPAEEEGRAMEGTVQKKVLRGGCGNECRDEEQIAEDCNKEQNDQSSVNEAVKESILTEGDETSQEEKQKESEIADYLHIDSSVSAKASGEESCNTNGKLLNEKTIKEEAAECASEQLEEPGGGVVDGSPEEAQVSKKGKGKSREDCVVA